MPASIGTEAIGVERCVSCDAPLSGPYCARYGERVLEPEALTLRHFLVHTVAHELLHVDGTLWRTLRLLFVRPGRLSLEYAAGRRRPYVNPFRLLLIAIVAYALMTSSGLIATLTLGPMTMSLAPAAVRRSLSVETTIEQVDRYGLLRPQLAAKKERLTSDAARARFHDRLAAFAQPVSFANVLLLAVTLPQFAYLAIAIRRFYLAAGRWGGRLLSVAAAMVIYVVNAVFMTAVQVAGAAVALALA